MALCSASLGRRLDRLIPIMLLAGSMGACTSLDGLTREEEAHGTFPDAPSRARDGGSTVLEAGPVVAADPTFCSEQGKDSTFCSDFTGIDPFAGWTAKVEVQATLRENLGGLLVATNAVPAGVVARGYVRKDLEKPLADEVGIAFDVTLDQIGATPANGGTLAVVQLGAPPNEYELQLNVYADGNARITERAPVPGSTNKTYRDHPLGSFTSKTSKRFTLRLRAEAAFDVLVDGVAVLEDVKTAIEPPRTKPLLFLGVTYVDPPSAPWTVRYDDVVVTVR